MFTKKMALEAAFEMFNKDRPKETVMRRIASETESLLSSIPNGVYSDAIRQQQIREVDLLIDHYCKLMRADGMIMPLLWSTPIGRRRISVIFRTSWRRPKGW